LNGLPYYKAYPRDFIEGTIGMSFELKGCYRLVLDLIYMQGGKLPDDARYISGLLGCSVRLWKSMRDDLVRLDKIQVSGEFLSNYRAVSELETSVKLQDKNRENAAKSNKNKEIVKPPAPLTRDYTEPDTDREERTANAVPKKAPKNASPDTPPPKRRTSIPVDWIPSPANLDFARSKNLTNQEIANAAEQFRNHHLAKGTVFSSWDAGWRTWVGNVRRFSGGEMAGRPQAGRSGQVVSLASVAARHRSEAFL
jgi:uncharacterized protein YdaU (DUF1376 family)